MVIIGRQYIEDILPLAPLLEIQRFATSSGKSEGPESFLERVDSSQLKLIKFLVYALPARIRVTSGRETPSIPRDWEVAIVNVRFRIKFVVEFYLRITLNPTSS
jgi:hypothetical protein